MQAARRAFIKLLGKIEEHLLTTDQGARVNELAVFRSLANMEMRFLQRSENA